MLSEEQVMQSAKTVKTELKTDEMDYLFDEPIVKFINGEKITVRLFTFGELPRVISLLKGVGTSFSYYNSQGKLNSIDALMEIISIGGENLIETLAMNIGKDRQWFNTISQDEGIELMFDFLKLNLSFFTTRVLPIIQKI